MDVTARVHLRHTDLITRSSPVGWSPGEAEDGDPGRSTPGFRGTSRSWGCCCRCGRCGTLVRRGVNGFRCCTHRADACARGRTRNRPGVAGAVHGWAWQRLLPPRGAAASCLGTGSRPPATGQRPLRPERRSRSRRPSRRKTCSSPIVLVAPRPARARLVQAATRVSMRASASPSAAGCSRAETGPSSPAPPPLVGAQHHGTRTSGWGRAEVSRVKRLCSERARCCPPLAPLLPRTSGHWTSRWPGEQRC